MFIGDSAELGAGGLRESVQDPIAQACPRAMRSLWGRSTDGVHEPWVSDRRLTTGRDVDPVEG
jgi:hypothetical protein